MSLAAERDALTALEQLHLEEQRPSHPSPPAPAEAPGNPYDRPIQELFPSPSPVSRSRPFAARIALSRRPLRPRSPPRRRCKGRLPRQRSPSSRGTRAWRGPRLGPPLATLSPTSAQGSLHPVDPSARDQLPSPLARPSFQRDVPGSSYPHPAGRAWHQATDRLTRIDLPQTSSASCARPPDQTDPLPRFR